MIKPDNLKLLEELGKTQFGVALREFLGEKLAEIRDVRNSKSLEDMMGNQKAIAVIESLFYFMADKNPSKKGRQSYE